MENTSALWPMTGPASIFECSQRLHTWSPTVQLFTIPTGDHIVYIDFSTIGTTVLLVPSGQCNVHSVGSRKAGLDPASVILGNTAAIEAISSHDLRATNSDD